MAHTALTITSTDEANRRLLANAHPDGWRNPAPAPKYHLVIIGGGTAGLVSALIAGTLGARVAIVERDLMGGDCLNFGCVPSKAIIRAARAAEQVRTAGELGVEFAPPVRVDFAAVMQRMRVLRAELSPNDSADRLRKLGIDVFLGAGRFTGPDTVEVEGATLRFRRAAIATGARAARLSIPGIEETGYLTNETLFSLTALPRRLAVIGGGPIGCEMAQTMRRFGAEVTLLEAAAHILAREDIDAAGRIEQALRRDGVAIATGCRTLSVERRGADKVLRIEAAGSQSELLVDEILAGVGRVPAVDGLGLEQAGIEYDAARGIHVDDFLRTSNRRVYAAGDVASALKFTHLSEAHARILIRNALFFGRRRVSALTIPWCTYTDPEIAHVGIGEADARARGLEIDTFVQELRETDRAVLDGETAGFVKLHVRRGTDTIVGATIVASHAGEMISELTVAMNAGLGLGALDEVIHPYPTQADAIRRAAGEYTRTRLTPFAQKLFRLWFRIAG
jgi:pyruvate/2-oxoglutarate dehydrogenase complex dihydrolipoamide dehydrogenase (E3) component